MRNIATLYILTYLTLMPINAQESNWLVNATGDAQLEGVKYTKIHCADVNNDNYPDLLVGTGDLVKNTIKLFINTENPDKSSPTKRIFVDFTEESNINYNRRTGEDGRIADMSALGDVDNDGDLDLVTSIYYHRWTMYDTEAEDPGDRSEVMLNDGSGHFTLMEDNGLYDFQWSAGKPAGIINTTGICFIDYDYDGIVDLLFGTWFDEYNNPDPSIFGYSCVFKGQGDGSFEYVETGIQNVKQPYYGANVTDWNNDGWQDIVLSNYCRGGGNLYKNNQDGTFSDWSYYANFNGQEMAGDHGQPLCNWEALPADFDNDGDMDFLQVQVHGGLNEDEGHTHIVINNGPDEDFTLQWALDRITRDEYAGAHVGDMGGTWFDIENDGWLDLAIGQKGYEDANRFEDVRLYICGQDQDHYFDDITEELGLKYMTEAHSMEPCDFDLDGDNDLVVSRQIRDTITADSIVSYMQIELLRNDKANESNWVSVKAIPPAGSNKTGFGTRIIVYSGGIQQIREVQAGMGHCSQQQPFIKNFGLSDFNHIDSIVVKWPHKDLLTTVVYNPPINAILEIGENGFNDNLVKNWDGSKPIIALSEPKFEHRLVDIGEYSEIEFNVRNIGDAVLSVSDLSFEINEDAVYELIDTETGFDLEPGEQQAVKVRYTPIKVGWNKDHLIISSNAYNAPEKQFDLLCSGYGPSSTLAFDKVLLVFDPIFFGQDADMTFEISNHGVLEMNIDSITVENLDGEVFSIIEHTDALKIESEGAKEFTVNFTPPNNIKYEKYTEYRGLVHVYCDAYNQDTTTVQLIGRVDGPAPEMELSTSLIKFDNTPVGETAEYTLTISNEGNSGLTVYNIEVEDDGEAVYTFADDLLPLTVAAEDEEDVILYFKPVEEVNYKHNITFYSNAFDDDSTISVKIWGRGIEAGSVRDTGLDNDKIAISVNPNPLSDFATLNYTVKCDGINYVKVVLADRLGRQIKVIEESETGPGDYSLNIDSSDLASGTYYIMLITNNNKFMLPVVIIR